MEVAYTEKFLSVQGEALHTGRLCSWLRLFACSLQCRGFGQKEPWNPETWEEQRPNIIAKEAYTQLEQVPTPHVGCDSDYSWSAKFKHLVQRDSPESVVDSIVSMVEYPESTGHIFTGGEPLMQQQAIYAMLNYWQDAHPIPSFVGFETNGTQKLRPELASTLEEWDRWTDVYFSISPKLLHVSGEKPSKAIKLDVIEQYLNLLPEHSYLKFVLNEDQRAWDQAEQIVNELSDRLGHIDVWVMPVGGLPGQQLSEATGRIADKAIFEYGWNVSPRVHLMIWGDEQIGR